MRWDDWDHMLALEREITYLRSLLQPTDTGHIYTAIAVLTERVSQLRTYFDCEFEHTHVDR